GEPQRSIPHRFRVFAPPGTHLTRDHHVPGARHRVAHGHPLPTSLNERTGCNSKGGDVTGRGGKGNGVIGRSGSPDSVTSAQLAAGAAQDRASRVPEPTRSA